MAFGSHLAPYVMVEEEGFGRIMHSMRKQTTTGTKGTSSKCHKLEDCGTLKVQDSIRKEDSLLAKEIKHMALRNETDD